MKMTSFLKCFLLFLGYTAAQDNTTHKTYANELERFFDNDYNKATYLVLPIMILVYGGCSAIYCIAKLRRYMRRRSRRKQHELVDQTNEGFIQDENDDPEKKSADKLNSLSVLFAATNAPNATYGKLRDEGTRWNTEKSVAVEVSKIDTQLKQAFAMIGSVTIDMKEKRLRQMKSKPDLLPAGQENVVPIKKKRKFKQKTYLS